MKSITILLNGALSRVSIGTALLAITAIGLTLACTPNTESRVNAIVTEGQALRPLTQAERLSDFDIAVQTVRELYGPMAYKERRFGYNFEDLVVEYRQKMADATDDDMAVGILKQFLNRLQDGHVSATPMLEAQTGYSTGLLLTPVQGRALVARISDSLKERSDFNIEVGDEVLEIDGAKPFDYMPTILKYVGFGNEVSDQHYLTYTLTRPSYMTEMRPTAPTVMLKFAKANGETYTRNIVWKPMPPKNYVPVKYPGVTSVLEFSQSQALTDFLSSIGEWGSETPFFANAKVQQKFDWTRIRPSDEALQRHGLEDPSTAPDLFAVMYPFEGKTILLTRVATYGVPDYDQRYAWYKALLDEYGRFADAFVVDQTHNPGGYLNYAESIVSLFANSETRGLVNFLHPDRRWMYEMASRANASTGESKAQYELAFTLLENAYDRGLPLTERPISFSGFEFIRPAAVTQPKPVLMLIDELAGSCGDLVPMLMQENGLATLFGQRTMGLGGNVEPVITLPHTQTSIALTRGHFTTYRPDGMYDLDALTENNGVVPDITYTHSVEDVRAGYERYVETFSKAAIGL